MTPEPICFGFGVCFILAAWSERTLFVIFWILSILLSQFIALCFEGKVFSSNRSLLYPKGNFIILRHLSNMTFLAAILYKLFGPLSDQIQPPLRESELMDICSPYSDTLSAYGVRTYPEIAEGISILKALFPFALTCDCCGRDIRGERNGKNNVSARRGDRHSVCRKRAAGGGKERAYFDDGRILQPVRRGKKRTMVRP